jgi:hypothetical protein
VDEQAAEKEELYDEINSLYNMENPTVEDHDDRRSTVSSRKSNVTGTTTTILISVLAK